MNIYQHIYIYMYIWIMHESFPNLFWLVKLSVFTTRWHFADVLFRQFSRLSWTSANQQLRTLHPKNHRQRVGLTWWDKLIGYSVGWWHHGDVHYTWDFWIHHVLEAIPFKHVWGPRGIHTIEESTLKARQTSSKVLNSIFRPPGTWPKGLRVKTMAK